VHKKYPSRLIFKDAIAGHPMLANTTDKKISADEFVTCEREFVALKGAHICTSHTDTLLGPMPWPVVTKRENPRSSSPPGTPSRKKIPRTELQFPSSR
jgi:hypothetical protein